MISAKADQGQELLNRKLKYANSTLPYLQVVVGEIVRLASEHRNIRQRLQQLDVHRQLTGSDDVYSAELQSVERMADELCGCIEKCYLELDGVEGITFSAEVPDTVEFPFEFENGIVHLSWRLGEDKVGFWHWSDESEDSRRPIDLLIESALHSQEH